MLSGILSALAAAFAWVRDLGRRRERADAERTGAAKQREADQLEEIRKLEGQLGEAVNRRPGDARRRLEDGEF